MKNSRRPKIEKLEHEITQKNMANAVQRHALKSAKENQIKKETKIQSLKAHRQENQARTKMPYK